MLGVRSLRKNVGIPKEISTYKGFFTDVGDFSPRPL